MTDSAPAKYKNKKIYFDRNLVYYNSKIKLIPIFTDFELKIPYSERKHFYSSERINVFMPAIDLVNYL